MIITNGGLVSNKSNIVIANNYVTASSVTVDGTDSQLTTTKNIRVCAWGYGSLNITNGGYVSSGPNSGIVQIGGTATTATTAKPFYPTGEVTVDGTNSQLVTNNSILYVGYNGAGTLNISNGGAVNNNSCYITGYGTNGNGYANNMGGTVTISGAASTWTNQGTVYVGYMNNPVNSGNPGVVNLMAVRSMPTRSLVGRPAATWPSTSTAAR